MRERNERQMTSLSYVATLAREITSTNPRVLHLKKEIIAHDARVTKLAAENRKARPDATMLRRGRFVTKDKLREDELLPLSRRGRRLSKLYPELELALKVPHKNASVAEIADAAERIADALTPHLNMLIKAKFPRNCLGTLRKDARALRAQAEAAEQARGALNRSNRELAEELAAARETIGELDLVLRSLHLNALFVRRWKMAARVGPRMGRPTKRRLAGRKRSAAKHGLRAD